MIQDYLSLITPLLLHMVLSEAVALSLGGILDVTGCTAVSAAVVIPVAAWMYRRDNKKEAARTGKKDNPRYDRRRGDGPGQRTAQSRKSLWRKVGFGLFCLLAGAVLNVLWSGVLNMMHISEYFSNETQEELLAAQALVQVAGLGFLVPVAEELIFRGLIYRRMKRLMPLWAAAVLSSLLFAVYHGNMIQMIFAFPMALALVLVYEKGKGFIYPVLFHMGANLAAVLLNIL